MPRTAPTARTVLVAARDEWSGRSLESILSPHGYVVLRAADGRQALALARRSTPDAIIADDPLPGLRGTELCRALREDPSFGALLPVIVLVPAGAERGERMDAYDAGAWDVCTQPLDAKVLLSQLATFIKAKREADLAARDRLLDRETGLYSAVGLARRAREIGADVARRRAPLACVALGANVVRASRVARITGMPEPAVMSFVSALLAERGRASDAIGRMSEREFGILAPGMRAAGAPQLVARLQQAIDARSAAFGKGSRVVLRAGYSAVDDFSESPVDAMGLLRQACAALQSAEEAGDKAPRAFGPSLPPA